MKTPINERFEKLLKAMDIPKKELAERTNKTPQTISNFFNGDTSPNFEFLSNLAEAFPNVNMNWFLTGKGNILLNQDNGIYAVMEPEYTSNYDIGKLKQEIDMLKKRVYLLEHKNK